MPINHRPHWRVLFNSEGNKVVGYTFSQPPKPHFRQVSYDSPPARLLYDLRDMTQNAAFHPWPFSEAVRLRPHSLRPSQD